MTIHTVPDSRERWQTCEGTAEAEDILESGVWALAYLRFTHRRLSSWWLTPELQLPFAAPLTRPLATQMSRILSQKWGKPRKLIFTTEHAKQSRIEGFSRDRARVPGKKLCTGLTHPSVMEGGLECYGSRAQLQFFLEIINLLVLCPTCIVTNILTSR